MSVRATIPTPPSVPVTAPRPAVTPTVTQVNVRPSASLEHDVFDPVRRPTALNLGGAARGKIDFTELVSVETPETKEDALAAIDELLIGGEVNNDPDGDGPQGTVVEDPEDVNSPTGGLDEARAKKQAEANAELEAAELEKLSPQERAQYQEVKAELEQQDDPKAILALQKLLFEGKLPGEEDLQGEGNLLDNLATLADPNTALADGIDRGELLADVVREVAVPSAIAQHQRGTCAATSVAIHLARENPAEYVRIMNGLASPSGEVELANGDTIRREKGMIGDDGSGRSLSQRLIEPSFMEYANGDLNYRSNKDGSFNEDGEKVQGGLYSDQVDRLLEGVFDHAFENHDGINTKEERDEAWEELVDEVEHEGRDVEVGLYWGEGGHKVLVTDISTGEDGQESVTFVNPWGRTETLPKEEFLSRLKNMNTESDSFWSDHGIDLPVIDETPAELSVVAARRMLIAA